MNAFMQAAGPFLASGGGVVLAAAFIALMRWARGDSVTPRPRPPRPTGAGPVEYVGFYDAHTTVETPLGLLAMGFRYCPAELQTVAVIAHPDGSATCADAACGTYIPAVQTPAPAPHTGTGAGTTTQEAR